MKIPIAFSDESKFYEFVFNQLIHIRSQNETILTYLIASFEKNEDDSTLEAIEKLMNDKIHASKLRIVEYIIKEYDEGETDFEDEI